MTYPMSDADREIQERARRFVDEELIPLEVETELSEALGGRPREASPWRSRLGLWAMNMPKELGSGGLDVPAGAGLRTDRAGDQRARVVHPHAARVGLGRPPRSSSNGGSFRRSAASARKCYAITEEVAGSDVDAIQATARRDGDEYVLNGGSGTSPRSARPTTSSSRARSRAAPTPARTRCSSSTRTRRGFGPVREPAYTHTLIDTHRSSGSRTCVSRRPT